MKISKIYKIIILTFLGMSIISGCGGRENTSNKSSELKRIQSENADLKSKIVEMQKEVIDMKSSFIDYTNKSEFYWIKSDAPWDKIIVQDSEDNESVEIEDQNFLSQFKLSNFITTMTKKERIDEMLNGEVYSYVYSFIRDEKIYSMVVLSNNVIKIDNSYYTVKGDISSLGKAYLRAPKSLNISNLITKIRMSSMYSYEYNVNTSKKNIKVYSFEGKDIISISNYLASKNVSSIEKPSKGDMVLQHRMKFYYYGSEILINVYITKDNKSIMEVTDGKLTEYFKQSDNGKNILSVVK